MDGTNNRIAGSADIQIPPHAYLAVDTSTGPNAGTLYCVYADVTSAVCTYPPPSLCSYDVDIWFTRSPPANNPNSIPGDFWETPRVINGDSPYIRDQFLPWVEVDDSGRLHLVMHDGRHFSTNSDLNQASAQYNV